MMHAGRSAPAAGARMLPRLTQHPNRPSLYSSPPHTRTSRILLCDTARNLRRGREATPSITVSRLCCEVGRRYSRLTC